MAIRSSNPSLECRLCDELFAVDGSKIPRLLNCGHSICHRCLTRLTPLPNGLACPFDRQITPLTDSGVWSLKKNFALLELLERFEQSEREKTWVTTANTGISLSLAGLGLNFDEAKERQLNIHCDEDENHLAILYCTVCESHLCLECAQTTHKTKVLAKHPRVPLSQKPRHRPRCPYHSAYALEFVCLEENCEAESPLLCILCRDYSRHEKHRHNLLETEAASVRLSTTEFLSTLRNFNEEVQSANSRLSSAINIIEGPNGPNTQDLTGRIVTNGSAATARQQVKLHFAVLREVLAAQESAALTCVDVHIRGKLDALHQQQEDLNELVIAVTDACGQLEKNLELDDTKLICAKKQLQNLISDLQNRKVEFSTLPIHSTVETKIPISFTKDNRVHIGPKIEMRVVTLGLDGSGKTSILFRLKQNERITTQPTIGFNVEAVEYKNLRLTFWDVGGHPKLRPLWKHYYLNTQALVFVIDTTDRDRLADVQSELVKLLAETELKDVSLLIYANKQDIEGSLTNEELIDHLSLSKLCYGRSWQVQGCEAISGRGLLDGLDWLARQLLSPTFTTEETEEST